MDDEGLGTWLSRRRARSGDSVAIVYGDERVTYRELADRADNIAAALNEIGISRDHRVAYFGENSPSFLATLFACASRGAVFVPINTRLAGPEIAHLLSDSGAEVLIHDGALQGGLERVIAESDDILGIPVDGSGDSLLSRAGRAGAVSPEASHPDHPAAIIYTSGTTGRAKGAVLTHRNLTWVALNCIIDYDVVSTDVALMISPLFHVASLGMGALPIVMKGGTLVLERGFDPGRALAQVERHGVTMLSGVPTTFQMIAEHPDWETTDLTSLRKLTCGGSPAPRHIIDAYEARGLRFSQGYGMTEAAPSVSALSPAKTLAKAGSVGLPHFFTRLRVVTAKGKKARAGEVGEIEVAGPNVFAGYLDMPEANEAAFTHDGWFRSGDQGYLDDEGYLFIVGRVKDMIISGAENIYPAEIEALLADMDGLTGAAVVGVPDERWGEVPWAVVTLADGANLGTEEVRAFLEGKVARYKLPKRVVVVDALPRTATGKVRKASVSAMLEALQN